MIHRLELNNFVPLLVSGINNITLNLGEIINLLISVNGAGKSTLLTQMNALPAENADFKDGRKYIEIMRNNKLYKLESITGKETRHSFKIDSGPELNTGGTISIQKKLVQQHFKLNTGLARVLTGIKGIDTFSNLSANRRKDILMELYPNDVDYAVGVYNKLKAERNNLKGAIKNQNKNLAEETEKLLRLRELDNGDNLDEQIASMEADIKEGLLISGSLSQYKPQPQKEEVFRQFQSLVKKLTLTSISAKPRHSMNALLKFIDSNSHVLGEFIKLKDHYGSLLAECRCQIAEIGDGKVIDPIEFKEHLASVNDEIERVRKELDSSMRHYGELPYFKDIPLNSELAVITEEFIVYLHRVVDASTPNLTSTLYQEWCNEKEKLTSLILNNERDIDSTKHKLGHIKGLDTLDCPKCTHKFKQGVSDQDVSKLEFNLNRLTKENEVYQAKLSKLTDDVELEAAWYYSMKQLSTYLRENGHIKGLYDIIKDYNIGKFDSTGGTDALVSALNTHQSCVKLTNELTSLEQEKVTLENRLELLNRVSDEGLFKKVLEFEDYLIFYTKAVNEAKNRITEYQTQLDAVTEYNHSLAMLANLKEQVLHIMEQECNVKLKHVLDNKLNVMNDKKNRLMKDIIRKASLETVVEKIEENLFNLKRRLGIVSKLMDGLCPNKGLIGKLMSDFIKTVCGNMNAVIKELWNGTLYIKPCSKENGDLTYKFPVVNGHHSETKDIDDCSDGQCDIINFVFRFVMLKYHDAGFPLIMDEIGVKFDEINRNRFFSYVNEYVNSGDCEQLFMISHYVSQYESFKHANIIGLKYDGLTVHGEVNKNTLIV